MAATAKLVVALTMAAAEVTALANHAGMLSFALKIFRVFVLVRARSKAHMRSGRALTRAHFVVAQWHLMPGAIESYIRRHVKL